MRSIKAILSIAALTAFAMLPTEAAQAQEPTPTSTTAQPIVNNNQVQIVERPSVFITFVPINRGISPSPDASFGCSIPFPTATETFATRQATWSGSISCSIAVGLVGTTAFFNFNTNQVLAFGSQINTTAPSASSSGSFTGVPTGTYEVNFNVDITPPPGFTTIPGSGCSFINGGPAVHCTVGSGTFNQP
jgi:hypothetical protein